MVWFTSDNHFFHKNIIRLSKRPFSGMFEMHEHLIAEWNKRVKHNEIVYVLGDFSFSSVNMTKSIVSRLNGKKILITGNHDMAAHKMLAAGFDEVHENIYIHLGSEKQKFFLSHFPYHPMVGYQKFNKDKVRINYPFEKVDQRYMHKRIVDDGTSWLLHGHVHGAWRQNGRQINVGVDVWDYVPVSHEKILKMVQEGPKFDGITKNDHGD